MTQLPTRRLGYLIFPLFLGVAGCSDTQDHTVKAESAHVAVRAPGPPLKTVPGRVAPKKGSLKRSGPDMAPLKL
jgi:hypothetical protein